jgi:hypothetical protein
MIQKDYAQFAIASAETMDMAMEVMCGKYKAEGYGGWLKLLEVFFTQENYEYDITHPYAYTFLSVKMMMSEAKVRALIHDLIHGYGILQTDGVYIWSDKFSGKMRYLEQKKQKLRDAGRKGGNAKKASMGALANSDEECIDTPVSQQSHSQATAAQQHFLTHNITLHNITEHNKTEEDDIEENPKPLKGLTTTEGKLEDEKTNTHLNSPPYESKQTVLPAGAGPPPPITNGSPP